MAPSVRPDRQASKQLEDVDRQMVRTVYCLSPIGRRSIGCWPCRDHGPPHKQSVQRRLMNLVNNNTAGGRDPSMALQTPGTPRRLNPPRPSLATVASSPNLSLANSTAVARKASLNALVGKPTTPTTKMGGDAQDLSVGDAVDVPGGMHGVVKFIGSVRNKAGVFAGVELNRQFAARGKNDGEVDGCAAASPQRAESTLICSQDAVFQHYYPRLGHLPTRSPCHQTCTSRF